MMYETTTFLNVDLDISSSENLTALAAALEPRLTALHVGRVSRKYLARFELRGQPRNPNAAIRALVSALEELKPRHRAIWKRASVLEFNIGFQAAHDAQPQEFRLDPEIVAMVARLKGKIVITIYGAGLA
jgi:hypothetical protein